MKCLYLSGPMTGIENFNFPLFNTIANQLREEGYEVINPAEIGSVDWSWEENMRKCLEELTRADAIVVLPNWEKSNGATVEVSTGLMLGMRVYNAGMNYVVNARAMIDHERLLRLMGENK